MLKINLIRVKYKCGVSHYDDGDDDEFVAEEALVDELSQAWEVQEQLSAVEAEAALQQLEQVQQQRGED